MLTLLEVKRHGQGICHNVQSVNYSSALIQLGKPTKVNDCYQIKSMPQQPLLCKSALKKKKKSILELRWLFFLGGTAFEQTTCQKYTFLFQHYSSQEKGFVSVDVNSLGYSKDGRLW